MQIDPRWLFKPPCHYTCSDSFSLFATINKQSENVGCLRGGDL
jgi:hypothetical protein